MLNATELPTSSMPLPAGAHCRWSDPQLVEASLAGDRRAWSALTARYKGLICSFPRRYGAGHTDAAQVYQLVCAELFVALPRLRDHAAVRAWVTTLASHQSYQWKRRHVACAPADAAGHCSGSGAAECPHRGNRTRGTPEGTE